MDDDTFDPGPGLDDSEDIGMPSTSGGDKSAPIGSGGSGDAGGGTYAQELTSKKIMARQRTFYLDLKESHNGKFIKISEISRGGQRSTIMFDIEDIDEFIKALEELKAQA